MEVDKAIQIIENNYSCVEGSFYDALHEECLFDKKAFWAFFDAVVALAQHSIEEAVKQRIAVKICLVYNNILKEFMAHFAPNDVCEISKFPCNYDEYIEALDLALDAYLLNIPVDENRLNISRLQ